MAKINKKHYIMIGILSVVGVAIVGILLVSSFAESAKNMGPATNSYFGSPESSSGNYAYYSVSENAGKITIPVNVSGKVNRENFYVHYSTYAGTATPGSDYKETSGVLVLPSTVNSQGQGYMTIDVPILDDSLSEGNETFNIKLYDSNASIGTLNLATVTIIDND